MIFAVIIGMALGYSYFFYANNYPIACLYKQWSGLACPSCGFSRAFSSFVHFNFKEGKAYNSHAFPCYLFMISQCIFRLSISGIILFTKQPICSRFIIAEVALTIIFFTVFFSPLLNF
jgi:hypothetical protein